MRGVYCSKLSHGNATKLTRQEQAKTNCHLRYLCDMAINSGFIMSQPTKLLDRPPKDYIKQDLIISGDGFMR